MRSLFLLLCLCCSNLAFASWRNYPDPTGPIYQDSFSSGPTQLQSKMRVVTFNIYFSQALEGIIDLWQKNPLLQEADVVLLQEVVGERDGSENAAAIIARRLGLNYVYVPAFVHPFNGKDFGVAILSPHPLKEVEKIILPYPHLWKRTQRVAVGATVEAPGGSFRAYSTHVETLQFSVWRQRQVDPILRAARGYDHLPLVVGGDFNSAPVWQRWFLFDYAIRQGWQVATQGVRGETFRTFHGLIRFRLDHIFARNTQVIAAGKLSSGPLSDHDLVWVDLSHQD